MAAMLTASVMSINAQDLTQTTAKCGETVTITATPDAGYKFLYWDDNHSLTNPTRDVTIDDKTTIYDYVAVFDVATCTVVATTDQINMGSVKGSGEYAFGASVEIEAVPASKCYRFVQWSDGNIDIKRTIIVAATETENTYKAIFEEVEFNVKVSGTNGKVTIAKK